MGDGPTGVNNWPVLSTQYGGRIYWCRLCTISCMPEEVLFKSESDQSREEIASYLRKVADDLDSGNVVTPHAR